MIIDTGDVFCDYPGCHTYSDPFDGFVGWTETFKPNRHWCPRHSLSVLFNADAAATARDMSIRQVTDAENEEWKSKATQAVRYCASIYPLLTTDHTEYQMRRYYPELRPKNPKSWTDPITRAARAGWIENTHTQAKSVMTINHRRPKTVWRSLIYGKAQI